AFRRNDEGRTKQVVVCLLVMVALRIYSAGSVESWTVAGGFGRGRFIALAAVMLIGYAALRQALTRPARRALTIVTVLAVYWNLALIAEFSVGLMDRQRLPAARERSHA